MSTNVSRNRFFWNLIAHSILWVSLLGAGLMAAVVALAGFLFNFPVNAPVLAVISVVFVAVGAVGFLWTFLRLKNGKQNLPA